MGGAVWVAAALMGLVGGSHCAVMCAAPCHALAHGGVAVPLAGPQRPSVWRSLARALPFHLGRLSGYALLGAVAATALDEIAWVADRSAWLHPVWLLLHGAMLVWGLVLLVQARQPLWVEYAGRWLWGRWHPALRTRRAGFALGMAWAVMPCGLLYSAALLAALAGTATAGAAAMLAFALGSGLWLWILPWLWHYWGARAQAGRAQVGVRVAGAVLVLMALWALWEGVVVQPARWCQ